MGHKTGTMRGMGEMGVCKLWVGVGVGVLYSLILVEKREARSS